jgi:Asp-tRNA(Asn)/Glu-tRNA(Gln) amidotransferase A subunit family amidase
MGTSLTMPVFFPDDPNLYSNLSDKMPVSIQIVGRRNEDEKVIAVAKFLEDNHITCSS